MVLKELAPGIIKLVPDGSILGKVLQGVTARTNAGRMSASVVISTEDEDRSGDIVVVKGIDLRDHARNPVALLNHDKDAPIGRFADPLGGYTVKTRGDRELVGEVYFNQSSQFAHDVFRAVEEKVFSGVSIGFIPLKVEKRHTRGHVYHEGRMVEGSLLTLGDNPHALVECVHKGFSGRPLCPELLNILRPLCPERAPVVTGGYEAPPMSVTKAYPEKDTLQGGQQPDPMAPDADPNAVDPAADPTADPNAQGGSDHKSVVDDALGSVGGSLWQEYCNGTITPEQAGKMFAEAIKAHAKLKNPGGDDDGDGTPNLLDDDLDAGDDGDESDLPDLSAKDDAPADDEDGDMPDLEDKAKRKAEKHITDIWVKSYMPTLERVADGLAHIATFTDPDPELVKKFARHLLGRMAKVPNFEATVKKALNAPAVVKAAPPPMDDLPDDVLAEAAAVLAEARQTKKDIYG